MTQALRVLAVIAVGLQSGAMLLVGVSWLASWQAAEPAAFLASFNANAAYIGRMMIPLGATMVLLCVAAAFATWRASAPGLPAFVLAAVCVLAVGAIYPLYYTQANAAFASGALDAAHVPAELGRWAAWHWTRTALGVLGFVSAVIGLSATPRT